MKNHINFRNIRLKKGMNGRLEKNTAAGQEVILHLTYESICRQGFKY